MTKRIALLGAGAIGSRHLQALARINTPVSLQVVDPSSHSLAIAKKRYSQMPVNQNVKSIDFFCSINELQSVIDLCIIATSADLRFKVLQELLNMASVKNIILEKVAFPSEKELDWARELLSQNQVNTWVNFPRRMYSYYQEIKNRLPKNTPIDYSVSGVNWGFAGNTIHHLDLMDWLTNDSLVEIDVTGMSNDIHKNKRSGFLEFSGTLTGTYQNGSTISLTSFEGEVRNFKIEIDSEESHWIIYKSKRQIAEVSKIDGSIKEPQDIHMPLQSELTQGLVEEIFQNGTCGLTKYEDTIDTHRIMLRAFIKHLERVTGETVDRCPIT